MARSSALSWLVALALPALGSARVELISTLAHKAGSGPGERDPELIYDGFPRAATAVGLVSVALWIIVYTPQIILNYRSKSGESLSLVFLAIWLAGDLTNLVGSAKQGLLPTVILLAAYYALCDIILIVQVYWYRFLRAKFPEAYAPAPTDSLAPPTESDPLLSSFSAAGPNEPALSADKRRTRDLLSYAGAVLVAVVVAIVAWRASVNVPEGRKLEVWDTTAQVVGWISAALYLGSRLPQIKKNTETKCQGLSLLMFTFAVLGNGTYVASILLQSMSKQHLLINASWLVGSGGTIFLDFIVLGQFVWYSRERRAEGKIFLDDSAADVAGEDSV